MKLPFPRSLGAAAAVAVTALLAPTASAAEPTAGTAAGALAPAPIEARSTTTRAVAGPTAGTAATTELLPELPVPFGTALAANVWEAGTFWPTQREEIRRIKLWNGSTADCTAGSRTTAEQQAAVEVINLYRHATGVPLLGPAYGPAAARAQEASLMMEAAGQLSHHPAPGWPCYSTTGDDGAGASNLALGFGVVSQVEAYMDDFGDNNRRVGHRQWLLSPSLARVGVGGSQYAAAIVVQDVPLTGATTPRAIAFPPAGHAPARATVYPRWNLSFHNVEADLSNASVRVRREGVEIEVLDHTDTPGMASSEDYAHTGLFDGQYGQLNTISWELVDTDALQEDLQPGAGSTTYTVTVSGIVLDGVIRTYSYDVEVTPDRFSDDDGTIFEVNALQLAASGITKGCTRDGSRFCPDQAIPREQIAAFFVRALRLPPATRDWFDDDDGTMFEDAINRLAEQGITRGCGAPSARTFCPTATVTRGQMAAFFTRALRLGPASRDWFDDDRGSIFEDAINRLATSGITRGCGSSAARTFCPTDDVTRGQMAAFFVRADLT